MHVPLLSHWQRGKTAVIVAPTQANRVVRHDVDDTSLRQRRHTHGTAHVVSEDEEGRAVGDQAAVVQRNAVADGSHAVLAHTEAQVALSVLAWRGRVKLCGREGDGGKEKTAVDRVSACACNSKANKKHKLACCPACTWSQIVFYNGCSPFWKSPEIFISVRLEGAGSADPPLCSLSPINASGQGGRLVVRLSVSTPVPLL